MKADALKLSQATAYTVQEMEELLAACKGNYDLAEKACRIAMASGLTHVSPILYIKQALDSTQ